MFPKSLFLLLLVVGALLTGCDVLEATLSPLPGGTAPDTAPAGGIDADTLLQERCTVCHTRERIDQKRAGGATRAAWEATIDRMIGYGAQLNGQEREALIAHLSAGAAMGEAAAPVFLDGAALVEQRCTVCHTRARIDDEDEDRDGWTEIVDRMISRGAQLSPDERLRVIDYLVATHGKDSDDNHGGDEDDNNDHRDDNDHGSDDHGGDHDDD